MKTNIEIENDNYGNETFTRITILDTLNSQDIEKIEQTVSEKRVWDISFDYKQTAQTWKAINRIVKLTNSKLRIVLNYYDYRLKDLLFLKHLPNVENLTIHYFNGTDISPIANLKNLKSLIFTSAFKSTKVQIKPLTNLKKIEDLRIFHIKDIEQIKCFTKLKHILLDTLKTDNLNFLKPLKNLESITLKSSEKIINYSGLYDLPKLKNAFIGKNYKATNAEFLSHLIYLERLHLSDFNSVIKFPNLEKLDKLKSLSITNCKVLVDINGIAKAPILEEVSLFVGKKFKPSALNVLKGHKKIKKIRAGFNTKKENSESQLIINEILK